jgi:hypothetical protein
MKGNKVAPDSAIFTIRDRNKTKFAQEKINDLSRDDFENFTVLFDKIKEIINE